MVKNEGNFYQVMSTITKGAASLFFELGHAIYKDGVEHAKNADGSMDIHITPLGATAGGHAVLISPSAALALIQGA